MLTLIAWLKLIVSKVKLIKASFSEIKYLLLLLNKFIYLDDSILRFMLNIHKDILFHFWNPNLYVLFPFKNLAKRTDGPWQPETPYSVSALSYGT